MNSGSLCVVASQCVYFSVFELMLVGLRYVQASNPQSVHERPCIEGHISRLSDVLALGCGLKWNQSVKMGRFCSDSFEQTF